MRPDMVVSLAPGISIALRDGQLSVVSASESIYSTKLEAYPGFLQALGTATPLADHIREGERHGCARGAVEAAVRALYVNQLVDVVPSPRKVEATIVGDAKGLFAAALEGRIGKGAGPRLVIVDGNIEATCANLFASREPILFVCATPTSWVLGPATFPGETACLSCLLASNAAGALSHGTCAPTPEHERLIPYLAALVANELERLANDEIPSLANRATRIPLVPAASSQLLAPPSASCPACANVRPSESAVTLVTQKTNPAFATSIAIAEAALAELDVEYADELGIFRSPIPEVHLESFAFRQRRRHPLAPPTSEVIFGAGAGLSADHARCAAYFEYFEHFFARYRASIPLRSATVKEIRAEGGFDLLAYVGAPAIVPSGGRAVNDDDVLSWVEGRSVFSNEPRWIPACLLFRGNNYEAAAISTNAESLGIRGGYAAWSGCSAGVGLEDTIASGLLELVERYEATCALRTAEPLPEISLEAIADDTTRNLVTTVRRLGYGITARDLTGELEIPVVEVSLRHPTDTSNFCCSGHAAHADPTMALRKAILEALQYQQWSGVRPYGGVASHFASYMLHDRQRIAGIRTLAEMKGVPGSDPYRVMLELFRRHGLDPSMYIYPGSAELGLCVLNVVDAGIPDCWGKLWGIPKRLAHYRRSSTRPRTLADLYMNGIYELGLD